MNACHDTTMREMHVARPPLSLSRQERLISGVCGGIAAHLQIPVLWVRLTIVVLTALFGIGLVTYIVLWVLIPATVTSEPRPQLEAMSAATKSLEVEATTPVRGAPPLVSSRDSQRGRYLYFAAVPVVAVVGIFIIAGISSEFAAWGTAGVVALCGAGLSWGQISRARYVTDEADEADMASPTSQVRARIGPSSAVNAKGQIGFAVAAGWIIASLAFIAVLARGRSVTDIAWALFAGAVMLGATALILLPVGLRLWRDLGAERAARAREAERADIAAHVHDSVLQTLSLIRSRSYDPDAVTALARTQERELRQWLYSDPVKPEGSMAVLVTELAGRVEESWQVPVDVVTVGDAEPVGEGASALLAATREALTNAARHARRDVRLFAEFTPARWDVFVRDRGPGFDPDDIRADRRGVRDSIRGRMLRRGGCVEIHSRPGEGTEVQLSLDGEALFDQPGIRLGEEE